MRVNLTIGIPIWLDMLFAWPVMVYRKWKYGYSYRRIYLGEGFWTILDRQDYYRFGCFKWEVSGENNVFYAVRNIKADPSRTATVRLHRLIMNAPKGVLVDHRNNDSLDNRKANLRLATHSQNSWNSRRDKSNTLSRYRGVSFSKRKQKWFAAIRVKGKRVWLGYFDDEIAAAHAYDHAARKYHKEFASLNFPDAATPS
jgi:hypothetical protein